MTAITATDLSIARRALTRAESQVGVKELPAGSNRGPQVSIYQQADSIPGDGYAWCCSFAWCWAYSQALGLPVPFPTASVGAFLQYARKQGWVVPIQHAVPGALVPFEFTGDHWPDHIGLAKGPPHAGYIETIEGNTSSDDAGSQSNGGCVATKHRRVNLVEDGVCVIPRGLPHKPPTKPPVHVVVGKPGSGQARVYTPAEFRKIVGHGSWLVRNGYGLWVWTK